MNASRRGEIAPEPAQVAPEAAQVAPEPVQAPEMPVAAPEQVGGDSGRVFYRGTTPGDTRRIDEPFKSASGKTFVARKESSARNYGGSIERIEASPEARILREEDPAFWRLVGRKRPPNGYIGSAVRKGETLTDAVNDAVVKAEKAGYDIISFTSDSDIGTVILNESAVVRQAAPPVVSRRARRAAQGQAEAAEANQAAQAKLNRERMPAGGNLNIGGGQQIFEFAAKALKHAAAEVRDIPRRARNAKSDANTDFVALKTELGKDVTENKDSVPFSKFNRSEVDYDTAINEVISRPRRVVRVEDLREVPANATPGVRDIIEQENLAALKADIGSAVYDRLAQGFAKDIGLQQRGLTDPVRKMQEITDGELGGAFEMSEIHGGREIEMAGHRRGVEIGERYRDLKKSTGIETPEQLRIGGKLLESYISRHGQHVGGDAAFLSDPVNRQLLIDSGSPRAMYEYVKEVRNIMDVEKAYADKINRAMGGEGIGDLAAYFPKVGAKAKFFDLKEKLERAKASRGSDPRSKNTAEEVFNPRGERRESLDPDKVIVDGREIPREWNAETVLEGYIDMMLRASTGDIALGQSLKTAKVADILADRAERAGNKDVADQYRARADIVRNLAQQKWNHSLFGIGAWADGFGKLGGGASAIQAAIAANKRIFDQTKYRMNPRFNLVTQWTSVLNPVAADPVAGLLALKDMGLPGLPTEAKKFAEATYEYRRKAMPHSQMRAQVEGTGSVAEAISAPTSKPTKFKNAAEKVFFDGLTQTIEAWANKYSALVGYHSTRNLKGLTPRQRALAAGETIFKTQSAFTFGERAGVLNSRMVQGLAPAQGYAVDLANQVREALGKTGVDTKLYGETDLQQARRAAAIVGAAIMQNLWQNAVFNKMRGKDLEESFDFDSVWDATLALPPFVSLFLPTGKSGRDMPNPVLPVAQINMAKSKIPKAVEGAVDGEWGPAVDLGRYWLGNWGGPGGAAASDALGGRYDFLFGADEPAPQPAQTMNARPSRPQNPARPERPRTGPTRGRPPLPRRN